MKPLTAARIARAVARANGERTYPGQPCAQGHDGARYTSNGQCTSCAALQRASQADRNKARRVAAGLPTRNRATLGAALIDTL